MCVCVCGGGRVGGGRLGGLREGEGRGDLYVCSSINGHRLRLKRRSRRNKAAYSNGGFGSCAWFRGWEIGTYVYPRMGEVGGICLLYIRNQVAP